MNCKNCDHALEDDDLFCENCGAKVIKERITTKFLLRELLASLGWDSLYWRTLKKMFTKPQEVLTEYVGGTRKKYINPFSHLLIGTALFLAVINIFKKDFDNILYAINKEQVELSKKDLTKIKGTISDAEFKDLTRRKETAVMVLKYNDFMLKYFNIIVLLFIPLFAFISKLTYKKPYNYGEHIVMNAYLYGTSMYFSITVLILAVLIHPKIYYSTTFIFMIYYLLVFSKIYKHSFGKAILKLLRFLLLFLLTMLVFMLLLGIIIAIVMIATKVLT
ncbi:DUF3667 domain-containing protein [Tenacibaculum sp. M341]|uniref:DUF3667 domain-containing protein n=1 Tax=Tenacibaculum sp. M341 TaxID=2530339 RepID=UPI001047D4EB|nr:DUF3667 domain-containing protein [Tenacibaculum sp. M341]TCI92688.1 DUF3667 domain-containing protein [Tenacibaculum sp. M341]